MALPPVASRRRLVNRCIAVVLSKPLVGSSAEGQEQEGSVSGKGRIEESRKLRLQNVQSQGISISTKGEIEGLQALGRVESWEFKLQESWWKRTMGAGCET